MIDLEKIRKILRDLHDNNINKKKKLVNWYHIMKLQFIRMFVIEKNLIFFMNMNMNINIECWSILILFWFYNFMIYYFIIDIWDFFWFLRSSPLPNKCSCKELQHSGMNVKKSVWNLELCLLLFLFVFLRYAWTLLINLSPSHLLEDAH